MKLIETVISETSIRLRYADETDPTKAVEWVDVQFALSGLKNPEDAKPELQYVAELQRAALDRLQAVLSGEIQRLRSLAGRTF
jgi:hypothetical protein